MTPKETNSQWIHGHSKREWARRLREQEALEARYEDEELSAIARCQDPEEPVNWEP